MTQEYSQRMGHRASDDGQPHRVAILIDEGSNPFELGCACEVFGNSYAVDLGFNPYHLDVIAPSITTDMRGGLFHIGANTDLSLLKQAQTIIVPNRPNPSTPSHPDIIHAIARESRRGARVIGLCTGAYTLAEAGILEGRSATVHWKLLKDFQSRFPGVDVQPDVLFVDDGDILTSAGSAAALDLCLHIVRCDYGSAVANRISRRLVYAASRAGGQHQFIEESVSAVAEGQLAEIMEWALQRLSDQLSVPQLAAHAHMSASSLYRLFRKQAGTTPLAWLTHQRLRLAETMLEEGGSPMSIIAHNCGLGTTANLRDLFHRHRGISPTEYRKNFNRHH